MKLQPRRLLPLFLVILFSSLIYAQQHADDTRRSQQPLGNLKSTSRNLDPDMQTTQESEIYPGAPAFAEATDILRKIKSSAKKPSNSPRLSGPIDLTWHYAKQLFVFLFMNTPPGQDGVTSQPQKKLSRPLTNAVKLLEKSAEMKNPDAIFLLAEMNFHGNYSYPRNYTEAFRRYQELAFEYENSTAQHMLGFIYATGIGGAVKSDQARALLYHTFAAEGGDIRSEMTVAFRHHSGISTPRNCDTAVYYYQKVADKAIEYLRSGPPGGHVLYKDSFRIADEEGGVYGEGASVSSSGPNARQGGPNSDAYAALEDVLDYIELMHKTGDARATFNLAKTYYDGARGLKPDYRMAKQYFYSVARLLWQKDGKLVGDVSPQAEKLASKAAGYIGRMYMRGEGVEQRFDIAQTWFKRGVSNGDALSQYHMGLMYLHGWEVPQDAVKAAEYFLPAADQDLASAQVKLGALFLDQGDVVTASKYFELAARNGHIEAFYYLGDLSLQGVGRDKNCGMAAVYYKIVAEKAESIHSSFEEANEAYEVGDLQTALVGYMMAAEQGFESAQANVAYLLDRAQHCRSWEDTLSWAKKKATNLTDDGLALIYWTRSAKQLNIDSMVKMGDYYLGGRGTPLDREKAATCYQTAAETMQCAQAMWNLGWMHENGIGVEQDFHLAKRYYDLALETNPREAYLPVTLALYKLRLRSWWNDITDGRIKSIQNEPETQKEVSFSEWLQNFLDATDAWYDGGDAAYENEVDDWDAPATDGMPGGEGEYYDDLDDGILDTLLIMSVVMALGALVYWRNRRQAQGMEQGGHHQDGHQQQQQQQHAQGGGDHAMNGGGVGGVGGGAGADGGVVGGQQQQQDRGMFPDRDDPNFMDWAAGGIGH
ncbi:HCP-like protein [Pseudovirgaria hyperparasitica]|uniref:HCP-like protein n=1 Tax=Pseudovirgaria hyperparasitica TaxID=470096 RepID=A0A6A6W9B7_9PEZI|nr:HCP-like protein [Pseudovirgaria hyperparasitica]KAF2758614.1 HCP-like protein [Pseudovirgaria hyperparasitica]